MFWNAPQILRISAIYIQPGPGGNQQRCSVLLLIGLIVGHLVLHVALLSWWCRIEDLLDDRGRGGESRKRATDKERNGAAIGKIMPGKRYLR